MTIKIGSKNFTEQKMLGEIYAQGLEAAGYKVEKELNLGDEKTALKAVKGGQIDGYPEYTGNLRYVRVQLRRGYDVRPGITRAPACSEACSRTPSSLGHRGTPAFRNRRTAAPTGTRCTCGSGHPGAPPRNRSG